jgi:hypothetical protein
VPKLKKIAKLFIVILFVTILSVEPLSAQVYALTDEQKQLYQSGIYYYDIGASECGASSLSGDDNISQVFNYLVQEKGLKDFQAAGILGNMKNESGVEPQRLQGTPPGTITVDTDVPRGESGKAWGLVQWDPAKKMIDPVKAEGKDPNTIPAQLDFLIAQLKGETKTSSEKRAGDLFFATKDVYEATITFESAFERHAGINDAYNPESPSNTLYPKRVVDAEKILERARSGDIDTSASPVNSCGKLTDGGLVETALAYAWPEYKGSPFPEQKSEYSTAIKEAKKIGSYIGGCDGNDCGGFVTRVMVDSGFEPDYNPDSGPTGSQENWARANWQKIGTISDTSELLPGDVAFSPDHTFMYVGKQPGFDSEIASASYSSRGCGFTRSPMAGEEDLFENSDGVPVTWYRKK